MKSILISCSARLSVFDNKGIAEITRYDDLELDKLGDEKTAFFIIIDDMKSTFNFLVAIMYSQLFDLLCSRAYNCPGGKLKHHVRFILDEFANIGQIPDFEKKIATFRSRNISASIIIQAMSQLKSAYKDSADTIVANCDSTLFLGSTEMPTLEWVSKMLGKETIDTRNFSLSQGGTGSYSRSDQKTGRELMTPDELRRMPGEKCVLFVRGIKPFLSDKYHTWEHKRAAFLCDDNHPFKIKNYIEKKEMHKNKILVVKNDEEYEMFNF